MDIKKKFEQSLRTKPVQRLFEEMLAESSGLARYSNLYAMIEAVNDRTAHNYQMKDECLITIVRIIQRKQDKEAGLILLTYLLAPGLQKILRDNFRSGDEFPTIWSEIWWSFYRVIERYSIDDHPRQVAGIILRKTLVQFERNRKEIKNGGVKTAPIADYGDTIAEVIQNQSESFSLSEYVIEAGINSSDVYIIIASRVYGESLEELSRRLGMSYYALQKRRKRAERKLKRYYGKK